MGVLGAGHRRTITHADDAEMVRSGPIDARGDTVQVSVLRLDDDGCPVGNRQARRMARRLLRKREKL